jgi:hypothetical protein
VGLSPYVLRPLLAYCTSPRWLMRVIVEQLVEWRLAGETEVLGENFVHHKSHMTRPGLELAAWLLCVCYYYSLRPGPLTFNI